MAFLPLAWAFLLTTFPVLLFIKSVFFRPPGVFSLLQRNTTDRAYFPLAMIDTFFAFMAFIAFIAFIAFMAFIAAIVGGGSSYSFGSFARSASPAVAKSPEKE